MTTTREPHRSTTGKLSMAEILEIFAATGREPLRFTAYDGSTAGSEDAELGLDLQNPRGATYLATAPGELGAAQLPALPVLPLCPTVKVAGFDFT